MKLTPVQAAVPQLSFVNNWWSPPTGFLSDHMEVMYDLDDEAAALRRHLGLNFVRAGAAGTETPLWRPRLLPRPPPGLPPWFGSLNRPAIMMIKVV